MALKMPSRTNSFRAGHSDPPKLNVKARLRVVGRGANNVEMAQSAPNVRNPRWWLSFRLSTLFLVVTAVAIGFGYPHIRRFIQFQRFEAFVDRDLRALSESERQQFAKITRDLLPASSKSHLALIFQQNWFVWRLQSPNGERFVLFQGEHIFSIPGISRAHIYFFDSLGRLASQSSFSTGWRIDIRNADVVTDRIAGESLIRIKTTPVINGADIATQYYALINGSMALVRLEDSSGANIQNDYAAPNHTIGPDAVVRTETEWIRALSDRSAPEILRTLTWLGGHHSRPIENPGNIHIESFHDAMLHLKVRDHPDTKRALEYLATNQNSWISEAAQLTLQAHQNPQ